MTPPSNSSSKATTTPPKVYDKVHAKKPMTEKKCAGCGAPVSFGLFGFGASVRYCEYTGKYYCHECHTNQVFYIPARVMHYWDFQQYPVCKEAFRDLHAIYDEPLFSPPARLCTVSPSFRKLKVLRQQLYFMKDFLMTCTRTNHHLLEDIDPKRRH